MNRLYFSNTPNIYFTGKRKSGQSYKDFVQYSKQNDVIAMLPEVLTDENCVGEGKMNRVYRLPNTDKFLFRAPKHINAENINSCTELSPVCDLFPNLNVGQPIAQCGEKMYIIIKQDGEEYSVPYMNRNNPSSKDIEKYMANIRKLSAMNQSAYDNFAGEVKELYSKNCYMDYFNSNNLMLTQDEINMVDIAHLRKPKYKLYIFPSKLSFMKIFTDEKALPHILPLLDSAQLEELKACITEISKKTSLAMQSAGLPQNKVRTRIVDVVTDVFRKRCNSNYNRALKQVLA